MIDSGKVIIVGSKAGRTLNMTTEAIRERVRDPDLNREKLFQLMAEYEQSVIDKNSVEKGFYKRIYGVSKLGINNYARVLAKYPEVIAKKIQVYVLCPGYVATGMTDFKAPLTLEEGIRTQMFLINLPYEVIPEYQGLYFEDCAVKTLELDWHVPSEQLL